MIFTAKQIIGAAMMGLLVFLWIRTRSRSYAEFLFNVLVFLVIAGFWLAALQLLFS